MAIISQVSQVLLSATTVAAAFCPAAAATARLTVPAGTAAAAAAAAAISLCRSTAAVGSSQSIRSACQSLPLSLYLSYSLPSLSWPESCVSPVCCPRFGPRFARHSLCLLPSSLAGFFFCCFKPFQAIVLQAKFGQKGGQNKKVFTLQRTWWNLWRWQSAKRKKKESTEAY